MIRGITELCSHEPRENSLVAYIVLGVSFLLEGTSFLRSVKQLRGTAAEAEQEVLEHVLATSDPTVRAVFFEDAAALVGLVLAAAGIVLHQVTAPRSGTRRLDPDRRAARRRGGGAHPAEPARS